MLSGTGPWKITLASLIALRVWCAAPYSLPVTPAQTLTGQNLEFPTALAGKPAVCVFGFTKVAGDRTKAWMARSARMASMPGRSRIWKERPPLFAA